MSEKTLFTAADYRIAATGEFLMREDTLEAKPVAALLGPVNDFSGKPIGAIELVMDNSDYVASAARADKLAIGVACLALLTAAALGWRIARGIARPIIGITEAMRGLASGDHRVVLPTRRTQDEISRMVQAVEVFRTTAIERSRLESEEHARKREQAEKQSALTEMAEAIERETTAAISKIDGRTQAMAASAREMSSAATRTEALAESASTASAEALTTAQTVASAAEQLSASIAEISAQMAQSTEGVGRAVGASGEARSRIAKLNEQMGRIGAVADMIAEIAAKTNLLALNATIEAARAGDAGKGFAVVASEVKALAAQTARSTQDIATHVGDVRSATGASVAAVARIEETISEIDAIATSVAASVEEQRAATAEIARNVAQTATAADAMSGRIVEVSAEARQTGARAVDFLHHTTALSAAVDELGRTVVHVIRTSTTDVDRRAFRRRPCLADATVTCAGQMSSVVICDISEHGCFAETSLRCSPGEPVSLVLDQSGIRLDGRAVSQGETGFHISFGADGLRSGDADRISLETIPEMVKRTKEDHVSFVGTVTDAVEGHEGLLPSSLATAHHCRLGRWYYGVSDPATRALASFKSLEEPHHVVHDAGSRALVALSVGDLELARREVSAMRDASLGVLQCLDDFGQAYRSTIAAPEPRSRMKAA